MFVPPRKTIMVHIIQTLTGLALPLTFYELFDKHNFTQVLFTTSKNSLQQVLKLVGGC